MKRESKLLLVGVFLIGCLASQVVATHFDVPAARAQTSPQRWEYACELFYGVDEIVPRLNEYGAQGWELVTQTGDSAVYVCLKRPL
jgi:hypothetical protein